MFSVSNLAAQRKRLVLWEVFFLYIFVSSMASRWQQSSRVHREKKWKKFKWRLRPNSFMENFIAWMGFLNCILMTFAINCNDLWVNRWRWAKCFFAVRYFPYRNNFVSRNLHFACKRHWKITTFSTLNNHRVSSLTFLDYSFSGGIPIKREIKWFDGRVYGNWEFLLWNFWEVLEKIFPH